MFEMSMPWWEFVLRAVIVYAVLLAMIRLSGKRTMGQFTAFDMLLIVGPTSKFGSVKELIAAAKAAPNKIAIGTITPGATQHLAMELFRSMAAIELNAITYKTTPEVMTALRAGDIQAAFEFVAPVMGPMKAGAVKALGITAERRLER